VTSRSLGTQRPWSLRRRGCSLKVVAVALIALLGAGCGGAAPPSAPSTSGTIDTFPSGDIRLAYRLDVPTGTGPFPAVVMGHGSGQATRHQLGSLAQGLVGAGFAVLRYDKRGVGDSGGVYELAGNVANSERVFPTLAGDMLAGVEFLKTRREVDAARIGLFGVSQAGWIIPLAASRSADVKFMILVVGPTVSVGVENYYSSLVELSPSASLDDAYARTRVYSGPHGFDPRSTLESLSTPGLWLLGGVDRSLPTPLTVEVLQSLQDSGRPYRWIVYPGADHNLGGADIMADAIRFLEPWTTRLRGAARIRLP
jgi:pimeloyl-ACP methyl ester carboxylesterase